MKYKEIYPALFLLSLLLIAASSHSITAGTEALSDVIVCLDPGYGGSDPEAVNDAFGLKESEINLDVSFGLKQLLKGQGASAVMTRSTEQYLTNNDRCSITKNNMNRNSVSVTFTLSSVTHNTFTYNTGANEDPDGDSTGTTIVIQRPWGMVGAIQEIVGLLKI